MAPELELISTTESTTPDVTEAVKVLESEEVMVLILRTKSILRSLHEAEEAGRDQVEECLLLLEAAKHEVDSLERFLENLIVQS